MATRLERIGAVDTSIDLSGTRCPEELEVNAVNCRVRGKRAERAKQYAKWDAR